MKYEDLIETFEFRGKNAYFVRDNNCIWDEFNHDEPIKIADELFKFIAALPESEDPFPLLDSLLDVFRDHMRVEFFWKRLLKTAAQFPKVFAPHLFELCIARPIQMSPTYQDLGLFLEASVPEFTPDQIRQIEKSILRLPAGATDKNTLQFGERKNYLIARIPQDLLQTQEAMQLLASFLSCNPKEVLLLAEGVASSSEPSGYNLDSLAVTEVVKLVETVLADYRSEVREGQSLEALLNLLDIFAKTGWSDALRLVWRLDEIFR